MLRSRLMFASALADMLNPSRLQFIPKSTGVLVCGESVPNIETDIALRLTGNALIDIEMHEIGISKRDYLYGCSGQDVLLRGGQAFDHIAHHSFRLGRIE